MRAFQLTLAPQDAHSQCACSDSREEHGGQNVSCRGPHTQAHGASTAGALYRGGPRGSQQKVAGR